jgi:hypothetical protein
LTSPAAPIFKVASHLLDRRVDPSSKEGNFSRATNPFAACNPSWTYKSFARPQSLRKPRTLPLHAPEELIHHFQKILRVLLARVVA